MSVAQLTLFVFKVPLHKYLALPALEAGKAVFCEWPLGNGLAEGEELAALARRKGVKTMVGLQARHGGSILKVRHSLSRLSCSDM